MSSLYQWMFKTLTKLLYHKKVFFLYKKTILTELPEGVRMLHLLIVAKNININI